MNNITVSINEQGIGDFSVFKREKKIAVMKIRIEESELIVYKTMVFVQRKTRLALKELLNEVVEYARMHALKIISQSKYVRKQFQKQPIDYVDVWEKAELA